MLSRLFDFSIFFDSREAAFDCVDVFDDVHQHVLRDQITIVLGQLISQIDDEHAQLLAAALDKHCSFLQRAKIAWCGSLCEEVYHLDAQCGQNFRVCNDQSTFKIFSTCFGEIRGPDVPNRIRHNDFGMIGRIEKRLDRIPRFRFLQHPLVLPKLLAKFGSQLPFGVPKVAIEAAGHIGNDAEISISQALKLLLQVTRLVSQVIRDNINPRRTIHRIEHFRVTKFVLR